MSRFIASHRQPTPFRIVRTTQPQKKRRPPRQAAASSKSPRTHGSQRARCACASCCPRPSQPGCSIWPKTCGPMYPPSTRRSLPRWSTNRATHEPAHLRPPNGRSLQIAAERSNVAFDETRARVDLCSPLSAVRLDNHCTPAIAGRLCRRPFGISAFPPRPPCPTRLSLLSSITQATAPPCSVRDAARRGPNRPRRSPGRPNCGR